MSVEKRDVKEISDGVVSEIVRKQIADILEKFCKKTGNNICDNNFLIIVRNADKSIQIVRINDGKNIIVSYAVLGIDNVINSCENWINRLTDIFVPAFLAPIDIMKPIADNEKENWIVKFNESFDPKTFSWPEGIKVKEIYNSAYHGMACTCTKSCILSCLNVPNVIESLSLDSTFKIQALNERKVYTKATLEATVTVTAQSPQPFIRRIGADHSSQRSGNGSGSLAGRADINVFVVDTGIARHPDLNVFAGRNFTTSDVNAWQDGNGHGTHVAGIIGALDNGSGVVGVAPGVRLWAMKVLGNNGSGSTSAIISALNWILNGRGRIWAGRAIVNMSLGGGAFSPLDTAVNNLINNGIVVCVAAGNSSVNAINTSPARVANAITVGATAPNPNYNSLASYSNFGSIVDILAPGSDIISTYLNGGYANLSGTSMATPVVAGTVALLTSVLALPGGNTLTYVNNVRNKIINTSALVNPRNWDGTIGNNARILVPSTKPTTTISVWAGSF